MIFYLGPMTLIYYKAIVITSSNLKLLIVEYYMIVDYSVIL